MKAFWEYIFIQSSISSDHVDQKLKTRVLLTVQRPIARIKACQ